MTTIVETRLHPVHAGPIQTDVVALLNEWSQTADARRSARARIILLSALGWSAEGISRELGLAVPTVYKWRRRFAHNGVHGLRDHPRSGQPRRLPRSMREEIVRITCEEKPPIGKRWSIRLAARYLGVTQHQIRQIWSDAGLKPHQPSPS